MTRRFRIRGDDGSLSLFTVIVAAALLACAAFLTAAAAKLTAASQARQLAEQAARAGAEQINPSAAYTGNGPFTIDPGPAITAAQAFLSHEGHTGSVTVTAGQSIQVTVTVTKPAGVGSLLGLPDLSATQTATADLVQGVTGPQP